MHYVSFEKDIEKINVRENVNLFYTKNPYNDIYSITFKVGVGSHENIELDYAARLMNYAGTSTKKLEEVKSDFHKIGTSYSFSCDRSYVYISMEGIEEFFPQALILLNDLIKDAQIAKEKIKLLVEEEKTGRKMEDKEPADVAKALVEYIRKGENSEYLRRLPLKAIGKLKTDKMLLCFKNALSYATEIHYCGKMYDADKVKKYIEKTYVFPEKINPTKSPVHIEDNEIKENTVYFVNDPKAIQSQIYFIVNGDVYDIEKEAYYDAFNEYFGGGFSGLVVQEIREYRSMAYSTGAILRTPPLAQKKNAFVGFIGTQADKTNEALDVFMGLLRDMPVKTERLEVLKSSLVQEVYASRPDFRELSETIINWQRKGFNDDPNKFKIEKFKSLTFEDIIKLYETELKTKPVAICIVGDKNRLDMVHIGKYGKIVNVDKKNLYRK